MDSRDYLQSLIDAARVPSRETLASFAERVWIRFDLGTSDITGKTAIGSGTDNTGLGDGALFSGGNIRAQGFYDEIVAGISTDVDTAKLSELDFQALAGLQFKYQPKNGSPVVIPLAQMFGWGAQDGTVATTISGVIHPVKMRSPVRVGLDEDKFTVEVVSGGTVKMTTSAHLAIYLVGGWTFDVKSTLKCGCRPSVVDAPMAALQAVFGQQLQAWKRAAPMLRQ